MRISGAMISQIPYRLISEHSTIKNFLYQRIQSEQYGQQYGYTSEMSKFLRMTI